jgi:hypothetical protein
VEQTGEAFVDDTSLGCNGKEQHPPYKTAPTLQEQYEKEEQHAMNNWGNTGNDYSLVPAEHLTCPNVFGTY